MNRTRFANGFLSGTSYGTIPSSDARSHPHNVSYQLLLDGETLRVRDESIHRASVRRELLIVRQAAQGGATVRRRSAGTIRDTRLHR